MNLGAYRGACVLLAREESRGNDNVAVDADQRHAQLFGKRRTPGAADPQRILVAHDQRRLHRACQFSDDGIGRAKADDQRHAPRGELRRGFHQSLDQELIVPPFAPG